jgi:hypothetical protein
MPKDLMACKNLLRSMNKKTSQDQIDHFLRPFLLLVTRRLLVRLPYSSLVDESEVFLCRYHFSMVLHAHKSPGGMNNGHVCGSNSETWCHPIDMINK